MTCPSKKRKIRTETETHREEREHRAGMETEIGVIRLEPRTVEDRQQPQEAGRGRKGLFSRAVRECDPANTLNPDSRLQNCEGTNFCCLSHPACGHLFRQPQENSYM